MCLFVYSTFETIMHRSLFKLQIVIPRPLYDREICTCLMNGLQNSSSGFMYKSAATEINRCTCCYFIRVLNGSFLAMQSKDATEMSPKLRHVITKLFKAVHKSKTLHLKCLSCAHVV